MSKPIRITEDCYQQILKDVQEKLASGKMAGGVFNYSYDLSKAGQDKQAKLILTPNAYMKTLELVNHFTSEVGWHGTVERVEGQPATFRLTNILVYPQQVTGATVNTDQEEYQKWGGSLPDEVYNNMHFHGHSHVNFGVSPSSVDLQHREGIISQLKDDDFYIFVIVNKKNDWSIAIYDMPTNTLYETKDVELCVEDVDEDLFTFAENAAKIVKTKTYTASTAAKTDTKTDKVEKEPEKKAKSAKKDPKPKVSKARQTDFYDDMDAYDYYEHRKKFWNDLGYPYYS